MKKCPGSLGFAEPKPTDISCPACGTPVEIWSDEATARCASCGKIVIRTDTQSCLDWCRYAKECLGEEGFREYGAMKAAIRQAALFRAVEDRFGDGSPEAAFSHTAARFAEQLCSQEKQADPMVVVTAAVLLCLAKTQSGSAAAAERPGKPDGIPPTVAAILRELHYAADTAAAVAAIQGSLLQPEAGRTPIESLDYAVLHDAVLLARLELEHAAGRPVFPERLLSECLTDPGRALAMELRRSLRPVAARGGEEQHG